MVPPYFEIDAANRLVIDGVKVEDVAERYGTPTYVIAIRTLDAMARRVWEWGVPLDTEIDVAFACKACPIPAVVRALAMSGTGAEVASGLELELALASGVPAARIIFNGPGKADNEIESALDLGIGMLNVECERELSVISRRGNVGNTTQIGVRIAPRPEENGGRVPSRFGVPASAVRDLVAAFPRVRFSGLHFHLGTNIPSAGRYAAAFRTVRVALDMLADAPNFVPAYLDVGGGFCPPISTVRGELEQYDVRRHGETYEETLAREGKELFSSFGLERLVIEPGRYLAAPAVCLLTQVLDKRRDDRGLALVVDAGQRLVSTNFADIVHDVVVASSVRPEGATIPTDVYGPLCYESDVIARGLPLPPVEPGGLIAVLDCGAYDIPLASPFIRGLPSFVTVESGCAREIRPRQGFQEVFGQYC
jgi:diaminopimelate decarboxylase